MYLAHLLSMATAVAVCAQQASAKAVFAHFMVSNPEALYHI